MKKTLVISATLVAISLNGCSSDFWFGKPAGFVYGENGATYFTNDLRKCAYHRINEMGDLDCFDKDRNYTYTLTPMSQQQLNVIQSQYQNQRS